MAEDVRRLIEFYKSPLGRIARALIREQIIEFSGNVRGLRVLGLGFATPYMRFSLETAERVLAFMPARQGSSAWPREGPSHTVLCDPLEMPLTDSAVDLIIAVHAIEHAADAPELMREIWRVAAPNAKLIVVVPRRRGLWAQRDNTPFGSGNPFSRPQLEKLLRDHSFIPEIWRDVLYVPPSQASLVIKSARFFERTGRIFGPALAGISCVQARKELFPAIARRKKTERYVRVPALSAQTAMELPGFQI
ncbi:methyltransferase domain-containing protein [Ramlibacter sp.]|uniref:class I SAM-dependent methyltransferase n=1 Tax=Ramlibacter sp. TaxID=1917967 RepID=UPI00262C1D1F|nr:methyltransferase domain-containing protein [Ramlibacter sp.]MDB5561325.1 SAM-dependent methyltransferase 2, in cluster with Hydroxyacylglutathione hydrolase [Hyphomicrobiales bacterium]MDB5958493.1 SAM-dependent methyltransferase 2, in cluster with Hydroxyacylglutathione hydrolase [Ramlibacter sp.]